MSIKGQQGEQLRMFMTARELRGVKSVDVENYDSTDTDYPDDSSMMWALKQRTAQSTGFSDKISREGVKEPVEIYHGEQWGQPGPYLLNGHHRVASTPPDSYVPVVHHDDYDQAGQWSAERRDRGALDENWEDS